MKADQTLPSLSQRVALTVVAAFAAVFVMLFIVLWREATAQDTGEIDRSMLNTARGVATTLDTHDSSEAALTTVALFRNANQRQQAPGNPPVHLAVLRLDGSEIHSDIALPGLRLHELPDGISTQAAHGTRWRVCSFRGQAWQVVLMDDEPVRTQSLGWLLITDLLLYLSLALPIVLLPVWWMVRRLLAPLAHLSATVSARSVHDVRPLPLASKRWRELVPLEQALNRLFQRTAAGLAREKAFVHDAAHELRTPLAAIATQAHVLASSEGAARPQAAARLQAAVERASHLTQQLLQLAQADGAMRCPRTELDLMNSVRDAMALLAERAQAQGTELDLAGPEHVRLWSDARALRSIIDNLLDNALRHGGCGGVVAVQVLPQPEQGQVHITVADCGPGIAADERTQVFERFWRGRAALEQAAGTGLGLAIVRECAHSLGGEVSVQDSAVGTRFLVRLPMACNDTTTA